MQLPRRPNNNASHFYQVALLLLSLQRARQSAYVSDSTSRCCAAPPIGCVGSMLSAGALATRPDSAVSCMSLCEEPEEAWRGTCSTEGAELWLQDATSSARSAAAGRPGTGASASARSLTRWRPKSVLDAVGWPSHELVLIAPAAAARDQGAVSPTMGDVLVC